MQCKCDYHSSSYHAKQVKTARHSRQIPMRLDLGLKETGTLATTVILYTGNFSNHNKGHNPKCVCPNAPNTTAAPVLFITSNVAPLPPPFSQTITSCNVTFEQSRIPAKGTSDCSVSGLNHPSVNTDGKVMWSQMDEACHCCFSSLFLLPQRNHLSVTPGLITSPERVNLIQPLVYNWLHTVVCVSVGNLNNPCHTAGRTATCYCEAAGCTVLTLLIITHCTVPPADEWRTPELCVLLCSSFFFSLSVRLFCVASPHK